MFNKTLVSQQVPEINLEHLFRAAGIYLFKPHVVNRKLFGVSVLHTFSYGHSEQPNNGNRGSDIGKILQEIKDEIVEPEMVKKCIVNVCDRYELRLQKIDNFDLSKLKFDHNSQRNGYVVLNKFLPRNLTAFQPLDVLAIIGKFDSSLSLFKTKVNVNSQTSNQSPCHSCAFRTKRTNSLLNLLSPYSWKISRFQLNAQTLQTWTKNLPYGCGMSSSSVC